MKLDHWQPHSCATVWPLQIYWTIYKWRDISNITLPNQLLDEKIIQASGYKAINLSNQQLQYKWVQYNKPTSAWMSTALCHSFILIFSVFSPPLCKPVWKLIPVLLGPCVGVAPDIFHPAAVFTLELWRRERAARPVMCDIKKYLTFSHLFCSTVQGVSTAVNERSHGTPSPWLWAWLQSAITAAPSQHWTTEMEKWGLQCLLTSLSHSDKNEKSASAWTQLLDSFPSSRLLKWRPCFPRKTTQLLSLMVVHFTGPDCAAHPHF